MDSQVVSAIVNILVSIDLASDAQINPDFAVVLQGEASVAFDSLTNDERHAIAHIVSEMAAAEGPGERKIALEEFVEAYGLDEDD
jgi:hypothetical protein